jgi:hypothetical protein
MEINKNHKMKIILSIILIFSLTFSYAQEETPSTKELQEGVKELQEQVKGFMDLFEKYEENTSDKEKKEAYDKVISKLDTKSEATESDKEDAFKVINAYIKADQGKKVDINPKAQGEMVNFLNEMEKGKQDALKIFEDMVTDDNIDLMMDKARIDLIKSGIKYEEDGEHYTWFTYEEYEAFERKNGLVFKPGELKPVYHQTVEFLRQTTAKFVDPH